MDALALRRHLDALDLLEHLDAALHLRRLGGLVAEAVDELLHPGNLLVLMLLGLAQPLDAFGLCIEVLGVVADVVGDRAQRQVGDAADHRVEEVAVVGDQDDGVRVAAEVVLEPVAGLQVEMVGRLVEEQQARLAQQQLGQRQTHLPATREVLRLGARNLRA